MRFNVEAALEAMNLKDGSYIRIDQDVFRVVVDWSVEVKNRESSLIPAAFLEFVSSSAIRLPFYLIYYSEYDILSVEESAQYATIWQMNKLKEDV